MKVNVIIDTVCPWCYIGKRRFEQALALRPDLDVKLAWRAFLLNSEMPAGGIARNLYLTRKFGSEARVRRIYGAIEEAGQSVEINFAFDRIARTPNSVDSHRLIRFAERTGKADAMVETLFIEYFINGRDIGSRPVLLDFGRKLDLDVEGLRNYLDSEEGVRSIYDENSRAHRLGVNGVPSFVFNEKMVISGAQEPQVLASMIDAAIAGDAA
ncbi:MAG: DsbA family oxidoreductase [Pseudomonadota bacterium]|nr:DsbA family oxidoreductase [Pseudomonadota bacterium]